jgi:hypothetical protein
MTNEILNDLLKEPVDNRTKKERLNYLFNQAIEHNYDYIGVVVEMSGFPSEELIVNSRPNFEKKLEYYNNAYDDDLVLKSFNGIKIVDFTLACDIGELASDFIDYGFYRV